MQNIEILGYLEDLAFRLGIKIVNDKLGVENYSIRGGLCKVKGIYKIFIDPSSPVEDQIKILARALGSFKTDEMYLLPFIREILEKSKQPSQ